MPGFGALLKALRIQRRKTQSNVVDDIRQRYPHAHFSQASYSQLEMRDKAPRQETVDILADYFHVNITYFYGIESHRTQEYAANVDLDAWLLEKRGVANPSEIDAALPLEDVDWIDT